MLPLLLFPDLTLLGLPQAPGPGPYLHVRLTYNSNLEYVPRKTALSSRLIPLQAPPSPGGLLSSRGRRPSCRRPHRRPKTEGDARRCTAYSSSAAPGTGRPPSAASRGGASRAPAPAARAGPAAAGATGGRTGRPRAAMSGESFHGAGGIARCCPSVRSVASARPGPAEGCGTLVREKSSDTRQNPRTSIQTLTPDRHSPHPLE